MGLGILQSKTIGQVPATVILDETAAHSALSPSVKHIEDTNSRIVLVPQPTDDPNDPLNWSKFEKHSILCIICLGTIVVTVVPGPMLNAGLVEVSADLGRSFTDITKLSGYLLLATGATGPFASALARKYGKRPVYLVSSIIGLIGCIVGECALTYNTLLVAKVLQGIATSTYESIVTATIGDLFFVHERGSKVSFVVFMLSAISNGVSVIAGVITKNLGWHYNFHILLPFIALQTIFCFLFVPETAYRRRDESRLTERDVGDDVTKSGRDMGSAQYVEDSGPKNEDREAQRLQIQASPAESVPVKRKSFFQRLSLYNGDFVDDSIFKMVIACPVILLNVGAAYTIIVSGVIIACFVAVSLISAIIFTAPPYFLTAAGVGYASTGPFIGGLLGTIIIGLISDRVLRWMTRTNGGIYEPEFRLPPMIIGAICTVAGLSGFGHSIEALESLYVVCFLWGLMLFGMTIIATVTSTYALDAFGHHRVEIFVMNMVFKNFFYYGVTNFVVSWYMLDGPGRMFDALAGLSAGLAFLTLPMYVYGKKYRAFWSRYNLIRILHLETDQGSA